MKRTVEEIVEDIASEDGDDREITMEDLLRFQREMGIVYPKKEDMGWFIMTWFDVIKEDSDVLAGLSQKEKKKLKKVLQAAEPSEYFGQDFTRMGELIDMMRDLNLVKGDKKMEKRMKSISEQNVDVVAMAAKLRKEYEQMYMQLREIVYPKSKGLRKKWVKWTMQ